MEWNVNYFMTLLQSRLAINKRQREVRRGQSITNLGVTNDTVTAFQKITSQCKTG